MVRGGQFGRAYLLGSLLLLAASLHPTTAYSAPGDPPSGSPAGSVYQLPLEQGRSDAAPKGGGGTTADPGGGGAAGTNTEGSENATDAGEADSLYRSENDFGSSSQVPGVAASGPSAAGGKAGGSGGAAGAGEAGAAVAAGAVAAQSSDNGNTSVTAGVVLLGAIALVAVGVGIAARRFSRRPS
ncbi:MAG: hypothetical protein ABW196_00830 [Solirubrobacterales bacterium]